MSSGNVINYFKELFPLPSSQIVFDRIIKRSYVLYQAKHCFIQKLTILNMNVYNYFLCHLDKLGDEGIRKCLVFNYAYLVYFIKFLLLSVPFFANFLQKNFFLRIKNIYFNRKIHEFFIKFKQQGLIFLWISKNKILGFTKNDNA